MFLAFCGRKGNPTLSAELVASYRVSLVGEGKSSSTVGVHLAAIKALTRAAVKAGLMPAETAAAVNDVKGAPRRGNRIGNWLTREQAQELLSLPDRESLKGKRDYAILALLLGCGLRRTELVSEVKIGAIAQRENRWVLVDITGKGNRVRSVAVPAWVKAAIDAWTTAAGITEGKIFRAVRKGGKVWGEVSRRCCTADRSALRPRDGSREIGAARHRRTCAKLCRKRGGDLEQIEFLLGMCDSDHRALSGCRAGLSRNFQPQCFPRVFQPLSFCACLSLVLTCAVYDYGGVKPLSWTFCQAALGLMALVYFLLTPRSELAPPLKKPFKWLLLAWPCYVIFQLLPLPLSLLRILSPSRAELLDVLYRVIPGSGFAPLSIVPAATFSHLLRISAYTLVFLLVREMSWRLRASPWILAVPLLILATFEGVLGVLQLLSTSGAAAHGTYYNRNHFAGFLEMILPFAILYSVTFVHQAGRFQDTVTVPASKRVGTIVMAGVMFLGILCSLSRMGFVSCVCSLLAMAGVALFRARFLHLEERVSGCLCNRYNVSGLIVFSPGIIDHPLF